MEHVLPMSVVALALALAWDLAFGEPPARFHFVVGIGRAARLLYGPVLALPHKLQLVAGAVPPLMLGAGAALLGMVVERLSKSSGLDPAAFLLWVFLLKCSFAIRGLTAAGQTVAHLLQRGELEAAKKALTSLVSRDVRSLDSGRVASAAVESLGENLCDSVVAPLLYYVLFGLPGALAYRVVNTLDAMYGYRGALEWAGKPAARLDDLANLLPARLSTLALWLVTWPSAGLRPLSAAWSLRKATESPNAGWPMAAMAGVLGVTLEKPGHYTLQAGPRYPDHKDVQRACGLVLRASVLSASAALIGGLVNAFR